MDSVGPAGSWIIFIALLLIDFVFYGFGAALQNLNEKEIEKKAEEKQDKKSKRILKLMEEPELYIDTVHFSVTGIHFVFGFLYIDYIADLLNHIDRNTYFRFGISIFLILFIVLTFGIRIPKILGTKYSQKWAYACVDFARIFTILFFPVTWLIQIISKGILHLFGVKRLSGDSDVTEDEIISMVNEGHEQGVLQESEAKMISNIFEFCDTEAKDIMTNRQNIKALDAMMTLEDATEYMLNENNSRYPVYQENLDHIIGILHLKDALRQNRQDVNSNLKLIEMKDIIREVEFVPETKNIDALFKDMQFKKTQMVIVIDEYGQTSGIIAMEDILEEIVGNIEDEYDEEEDHIEEKGQDEYLIEGMTPLDELEEKFDISFDEEEFETLNGYMISKMDKIPEENEDFDINIGDYNFKITKVEDNMIREVLVTKKKKELKETK